MSEFTYFEDGQIDRVMGLIWQLGQETFVARQRILALEKMLVTKGLIEVGELDAFAPEPGAQARLTTDGKEIMSRLLRTISEVDDNKTPLRDQFAQELAEVNLATR